SPGGPRGAAPPRRHRGRSRLPGPPGVPVGQARRAEPRWRHHPPASSGRTHRGRMISSDRDDRDATAVTLNLTVHQNDCPERATLRVRAKGKVLVKTRMIALVCAVALVAAACGSRLDDTELSAGSGTGGGGAPATQDATKGPGISQGEGEDTGPMVGTLPVPCGQAPEGVTLEAPADAPGVSADTIKIAVISDKAGQVKVPTVSIEESVEAFVGFCNEFGGINGRKLELTTIDSKLFNHLEATEEACNSGVFALVGSGSVTDSAGAQTMVDCGLIEIPAYTVMPAKSLSDSMVQPLPNPANAINDGPARYMVERFPDAVKKAGILHGGIEAIDIQADRMTKAYEAQGFEYIYDKRTGVLQESYASEVKAMRTPESNTSP